MSEHTIKMLYKERAEQAEKIDAIAAENAKLRGLIKDIMEFLDKPVPDVHSLNQTQREEYIEDKIELEGKINAVLQEPT